MEDSQQAFQKYSENNCALNDPDIFVIQEFKLTQEWNLKTKTFELNHLIVFEYY